MGYYLFITLIKIKRTTTRVTRSAKDAENINARPSRLTTRAKSALAAAGGASTAVAATAAVNTRATASTAASKAKSVTSTTTTTEAAGAKRKRDVLVEVTGLVTNHKGKSTSGLKGKEKEATGNTMAATKTAKAAVKPSVKTGGVTLRRVLRSASESTATSNSKTDANGTALEQDEKMEVDDPLDVPPPPPVASSVTTKRLSRVVGEEDLGRVFKKRHTEKQELAVKELEVLDESQVEADKVAADLVEEIAPPSVQLWDDLDAQDWDDPVMVSEYVAEVCVYLKQVEVRFLLIYLQEFDIDASSSWRCFQTQIIWTSKEKSLGNTVVS